MHCHMAGAPGEPCRGGTLGPDAVHCPRGTGYPTQCTVRKALEVPRNALPHGTGTWRAVQRRHPGPDAVHCQRGTGDPTQCTAREAPGADAMHCQGGARGSTQCTATWQGHLESRAREAPGAQRSALPGRHWGPDAMHCQRITRGRRNARSGRRKGFHAMHCHMAVAPGEPCRGGTRGPMQCTAREALGA
ncbi:hypothetical protein NDU88_008700 [Pleurodeles waltl]|uniref:Uncharacterized protein n=1 Tax=Pleurodeles waltl TaxID=8319 RepID=A0AAV7N9L2_PLEWA|nr:hypothetical protein NDU88_008700 [Pleurodeles waltl]